MGADQNGGPGGGPLDNGILHAPDAERVEAGEGFIEKNRAGAVEKTAGDGQLLLHAARQFAGQLVRLVGDFQFFQEAARDFLVMRHVVDAGRESQVLRHRQVIEQARFVRKKGQVPLGFNGIAPHAVPADLHRAARRRDDAGEAAEGGGFARAIGADQPDDFPGADGEGKIVDRGELAV